MAREIPFNNKVAERFISSEGGGGLPDFLGIRITDASAGSMTLYMELFDGKTGDIIGKIIDPEAAEDSGMMQISSSVSNTADFDRIVKRWAQILNTHLAQVSKN